MKQYLKKDEKYMPERDDFTMKVKNTLAKRVGYRCSNPMCRKLTIGPKKGDDGAMMDGIAAHITAAAQGGPRYCPILTAEERSSIDNGIWLCSKCSILIDRDVKEYTVDVLKQWKAQAEKYASDELIGLKTGNDATSTKIFVKKWVKLPELKDFSGLDIMFIQNGGIFEKGCRWFYYINSVKEWQRPYLEAIREEIISKGIKWTGKEMQENPKGIPVFNNGKLGLFTWRAWGDLLAATWAESEDVDYSYIDFCM